MINSINLSLEKLLRLLIIQTQILKMSQHPSVLWLGVGTFFICDYLVIYLPSFAHLPLELKNINSNLQ